MITEVWHALVYEITGVGDATSYLHCKQLMSLSYTKLDYEAVGFVNMQR